MNQKYKGEQHLQQPTIVGWQLWEGESTIIAAIAVYIFIGTEQITV